MGRSFKRDREDIWDGEYSEESFLQRKDANLNRREAKRTKLHDHEQAYEVAEDEPRAPIFRTANGHRQYRK